MSLNLNWIKSYDINYKLFWQLCFSILEEKKASKMAIFWPFVVFFWQLHRYLSQNWDSDGHFEVLSVSKFQLNQFYDINYKCPWQVCFSILEEKKSKINVSKMANFDHLWSFFWQLHRYLSQNWHSEGHFEVLRVSKSYLDQKLWH